MVALPPALQYALQRRAAPIGLEDTVQRLAHLYWDMGEDVPEVDACTLHYSCWRVLFAFFFSPLNPLNSLNPPNPLNPLNPENPISPVSP